MSQTFSDCAQSISLTGKAIPGAEDRQSSVPGFNQQKLTSAHVLCIGAGGLMSHIAPTLVRKGIGRITLLDNDEVDVTNLNRQRFYEEDIGQNKAIALAHHLQRECIFSTRIDGYALSLQAAAASSVDLRCDIAVCGVDNNLARSFASKFFRGAIPVVFTAVSADADHGYVFVQEKHGPCFKCVFPASDDETYPCPGTPAIADILQLTGALAVFAIDTCITARKRSWNYRELFLSDTRFDRSLLVSSRADCKHHAVGETYDLVNTNCPEYSRLNPIACAELYKDKGSGDDLGHRH